MEIAEITTDQTKDRIREQLNLRNMLNDAWAKQAYGEDQDPRWSKSYDPFKARSCDKNYMEPVSMTGCNNIARSFAVAFRGPQP